MPYKYNPFTSNLDNVGDGGSGGGTVTNFSFTDGNGFDGTVTDPTTTPTLELSTTVGDTEVLYSSNGALTGSSVFTYDVLNSTLNVLNISGNGQVLHLFGDGLTLEGDPGSYVRIITGNLERLRVDDDGAWLLAAGAGTATQVFTSNGPGVPPTWEDSAGGGISVSTVVTSSYTTLATDDFIPVDTTGGAVPITLYATPTNGMTQIIKDVGGNAPSENITIIGNIDGNAGGTIITQAYGSRTFTWNTQISTWMQS